MKPHIMKKADFLKDKGIVQHNDGGVFVAKDGNKYQFGVEIDVDTVAFMEETTNKEEILNITENLLYEMGEIKERFDGCFPE